MLLRGVQEQEAVAGRSVRRERLQPVAEDGSIAGRVYFGKTNEHVPINFLQIQSLADNIIDK